MTSSIPVPARYGTMAIALHWLLGLALVGLFGLGVYMTDLPLSPTRMKLYNWHKWAGVSLLALSLLRVLWRLTHRPPALPADLEQAMPGWQKRAHHGTHLALYVLFFAVPLSGWAYSSAAGFPVVFLGRLPLPDFVPASEALADVLKAGHAALAFLLAALVLVHVAAALKHHWIDNDGLLQRMLPGRR